ncbi:MAG: hypothetical protein WDN25_30145 [Acetobacteraceae bacterium]
MTVLPPDAQAAATLRPNGYAYEAEGELVFYGIPGMTLRLRRTLQSAVLGVRQNGRRVGSGRLEQQRGNEWRGSVVIEGMRYDARAIRDEPAREWHVTLTIPAAAFA